MGHYFDDETEAPSMPRDVELWLPDMSLTLTTDRGVFGYGAIDAGSKLLLLKAAPPPPTGDLLDLGCGVGTIALPMARRAPNATVLSARVSEVQAPVPVPISGTVATPELSSGFW